MIDGRLLNMIANWVEQNGRPPTIPECASVLGVKQYAVRSALSSLSAQGIVTKVPDQNAVELHL